MGHENKCANLHGHNYVALFTAEAEELDSLGRVIDFSVLKARIGGWIDKYWDHGFIFYALDNAVEDALVAFGPTKHFATPFNPTAENMAAYLCNIICPQELADTGIVVTRVRLWETENCYADAYARER